MDVASTCNTRIKTILVHSFANWLVIKMTRLKTGRLITILVVASTCIFVLFKHGPWEEGDEMVVKHAGSHQQVTMVSIVIIISRGEMCVFVYHCIWYHGSH